MLQRYFSLLLILCFHNVIMAQVHPADGASLHYRLIGFTFPADDKATDYEIVVFEKAGMKRVAAATSEFNRIIATVPEFGKTYQWQVKYYKKKRLINTSPLHEFKVAANPFSNPEMAEMVIIDSAKKYKDMMMFFDNARTLYNMSGQPLWFLPVIPGITDSTQGVIRDMKLTKDGTITLITKKNIHEIDYDGHVLWSGPNDGSFSGDTTENYHHQFDKLPNGHYMVIADEMTKRTGTPNANNEVQILNNCGSLVEYNADKKVVWSWNSCEHLHQDDLSLHFNSFFLDEQKKVFYTSFRNVSRVVKAAYPSGKVLAQYGEYATGDTLFYAQHNVGINSDSNMILFNNNFIMHYPESQNNKNRVSSIIEFKEPSKPGDSLIKLWEFSCDIDDKAEHIASGAGSITELDKGDYLVCMGRINRTFIVSKDKEILWNVLTVVHHEGLVSNEQYRVSPVYPKDLTKLLFR